MSMFDEKLVMHIPANLYIQSKCALSLKTCTRVTSLEQLSVAESNGDKVRPKVYERLNGHKKALGIWFNLVLMVKYSTILVLKVDQSCL